VCGGEVVQREDDTEEAITRRLELYARQTAPLLDFYRRAHLLATVNGTGSADMVTRRVVRAIDRQLMDDRGRPRSEGD
jgi:adenylate kinase